MIILASNEAELNYFLSLLEGKKHLGFGPIERIKTSLQTIWLVESIRVFAIGMILNSTPSHFLKEYLECNQLKLDKVFALNLDDAQEKIDEIFQHQPHTVELLNTEALLEYNERLINSDDINIVELEKNPMTQNRQEGSISR